MEGSTCKILQADLKWSVTGLGGMRLRAEQEPESEDLEGHFTISTFLERQGAVGGLRLGKGTGVHAFQSTSGCCLRAGLNENKSGSGDRSPEAAPCCRGEMSAAWVKAVRSLRNAHVWK